MAYYLMNSMGGKGKENLSKDRSKLAINVIVPHNSEVGNQQSPVCLQQIHEEYDIRESVQSTKREKKSEVAITEGRMKLRDYLFLAQTSASKNAEEKKKVLSDLNENGGQCPPKGMAMKKSKAELRKNKYAIKNSEMFHILKEEMEKELAESIGELTALKERLGQQLMQHTVPSNGQMVMMYNLRSLLKHKLRKSIDEMKDLVESQHKSKEEERVEMEFDLEEEGFGREFKLASSRYVQSYFKGNSKG